MTTHSKINWDAANWPRVSRLREPYEYWPRKVVGKRYESDTGDDLLGPNDSVYHVGKVSPDLLRLNPGDTDSFVEFVEALGIVGLVRWVGGPRPGNLLEGFEVWKPLCIAVQDGDPTLYRPDLNAAWTHPRTVERFTKEHKRLTKSWEAAADLRDADSDNREYARAALQRELFDVQFKHPYPYELEFAITTVTNQVVERPRHILAQSAFELLDTLTDQLPKRCERCTTPFPPTRTDQRHCSKKCQQKAYQQSYDKTPHRKEYQRTYRRYKRGSITEAQWIEWKKSRKET